MKTPVKLATLVAIAAALRSVTAGQLNHCYKDGPGQYNKEDVLNKLPALCEMLSGWYSPNQQRIGSLADGSNCWDFYIFKSSAGTDQMTASECVANLGGQVRVCDNGGLTRQGKPSWDFSSRAEPGYCTNPQPDLSNVPHISRSRRGFLLDV